MMKNLDSTENTQVVTDHLFSLSTSHDNAVGPFDGSQDDSPFVYSSE